MNRSRQITEKINNCRNHKIALPTVTGHTHKFLYFQDFLFFMIFKISVVFCGQCGLLGRSSPVKKKTFLFEQRGRQAGMLRLGTR